MTKVCLFLVYFACVYNCIQTRLFNEGDYLNDPSFDNSKQWKELIRQRGNKRAAIIRQRSGTDMHLKCNLGSCIKEKVIWEFKRCEADYKMVSCTNFYEENEEFLAANTTWFKLTDPVIWRKCAVHLVLRDLSEKNSGLYRCSVDGIIIKMFQVEIIESLSKFIEQPPELLTIVPSNITIQQNMQFIIQCKVYSKQPPVIWWFKQSDGSNYDIQYYDKYYNRINTTVQVYPVPHEVNVYLSKLNVYHAQYVDSGIYVCLAMTESGKDYKDAIVQVITTNQRWEPHTSFFLLFLIPIIFALIPVTVWLWYYRKKKKNEQDIQFKSFQEGRLTRPILCDNTGLSDNTAI